MNLSVTNGSASPEALTITAGSTTSNAATVTPANQTLDTVVSVSGATFTSGTARGLTPVPGPDLTIPAAAATKTTVTLSETSPITEGTKVTATMSFAGIPKGNEKSHRFRMDMLDSQGNDTASCKAAGMGALRYMNRVDQDPETRASRVSTSCPAGEYTVRATFMDAGENVLSTGDASLTIR